MPDGPNAPPADVRYAGFWIRAAARVLDILLIVAIFNVVYLIDKLGADAGLWNGAGTAVSVPGERLSITNILRGVFYLGFPLFYYVYLHGASGQTFGKMAFHIRVVNLDGTPIDYRRALMRSLMEMILSFILGFFIILLVLIVGSLVEFLSAKISFIGSLLESAYNWIMVVILVILSPGAVFIWALLDPRKQGLHDKACGTIVVRLDNAAAPAAAAAGSGASLVPPPPVPSVPAAPQPPDAPASSPPPQSPAAP